MREILLATNNPGKAKEIGEILSGSDPVLGEQIRWRALSEFAEHNWTEPVEDGDTFLANAEIKARHYAKLSGLWTIADDSGLQVDALNGEPGVRSSRYAGEPSNAANNNALLVKNLAGVPDGDRTARFRCVCVLHDGEQILASAEGTVEGRIVEKARGTNGFGYDPHFYVERFGMTCAQMESDQKHAISHRGQALGRLSEQLAKLV